MTDTNDRSERALEIAKKQGTLWYRIKKSKSAILTDKT